MLALPSIVQVAEVGPRDGLQGFERPVAAAKDVAAILGMTPKSHAGGGATRGEIAAAAMMHGREHPV
jgi:hypothetical protein